MAHADDADKTVPERRTFFSTASNILMGGGILAAYGTLAGFMGRFLYPARSAPKGWMYVTDLASFEPETAIHFKTPSGERVLVTRRTRGQEASDFIALSGTCPHLGCQVFWEQKNERFFCPCHNGVFNPEGKATEGPPAKENQELLAYPLKVEGGLLYIEVPLETLAQGDGETYEPIARGGGHDPCLDADSLDRG
ncbi:MAG: ubiquinol-cytochrome c reductase iron-sulfur subunit [Candidatus Eisenbacteria bacterium]|uniref:Ubiquinol-cytochrome c reductase iron-sulfur subunit n=1 Tax=Eiseniibacteriota bacterium TaxID=2212470 RepID=A0A7Y2EAI1_UNCEI|nr:ubiquinol-cytochrome c reductase iron-sulfur subunit [Candidatus Eisenbacteria bacterium]